MAIGKPDSRKTHVTRIFGTNKKGDRLDDIWADVERMDIVKSALQVPPNLQWQGVQRKFRWGDDPNADDYSPDGPPSRIVEIVKVCDPVNTADISDPEEWIPLKVIRGLRGRVETGTAANGGTAMERFLHSLTSDELQTARVVEVRKIVHRDTNVDAEIQAAADADPSLREYVVPGDDYARDDATKDATQYIEQEIITYLKHKGNAGDVAGLARQTKLLNEYLIDASDPPEGKVVGTFGFNPPYRLDPYQSIVNVSFGGLAVEFAKSSLLENDLGIPAFQKVTISLWFRVPGASIASAQASYDGDAYPPKLLNGILPLVVFGQKGEQQDQTTVDGPVIPNAYYVRHFSWTGSDYTEEPEGHFSGWQSLFTQTAQTAGSPFAKNPSFVGIDCSSSAPRLCFNFETGLKPDVAGLSFVDSGGSATDYVDYFYDFDPETGDVTTPEPPDPPLWEASFVREDVSSVGYTTAAYGGLCPGATIKPETWHHLLLSLDLSVACTVKGVMGSSTGIQPLDVKSPPPHAHVGDGVVSAPKMWVAFDDQNLTRGNLATIWPEGHRDDNAIIATGAAGVALLYNISSSSAPMQDEPFAPLYRKIPAQSATFSGVVTPSYSIDATNIPASDAAIGVPASSAFADDVQRVELAELQIFTGVKMDTGNIANRRLFITKDGRPNTDYSKVDEVLGRPARRIHGSAAWKAGRDTGYLTDGETGSSGRPHDFVPSGDIEKYRPDPSLNGPQG